MSGVNNAWLSHGDITINYAPDSDLIEPELRDYCNTHPLADFYVAVNTIIARRGCKQGIVEHCAWLATRG
jgi:hypothetical protein